MNDLLKSHIIKNLEKQHLSYDEEFCMISMPVDGKFGYHTKATGKVHSTLLSLNYAVALLDSGDKSYTSRAIDILRKVVPLQDTDPESETYGIWSWYLEEPLESMNPPDKNWADFCGTALLQAAMGYSNILPKDVNDMVKQAILHACREIKLRDVGPDYTNISLMGTYVTHVAGEFFNDAEILDYAKARLKNLHAFDMHNGEFIEYNSPNYTVIAIEEISRMLNHIKCKKSLAMIKDLNNMAWRCLATHFHTPTLQWGGPHTRSYNSFADKKILSLIQLGCNGKVKYLEDDELEISSGWAKMKIQCPEEYVKYFADIPTESAEKCIYNRGEENSMFRLEYPKQHGIKEIAYSYINPKYTLGTFYKTFMWAQRRALIGYFGTRENPVFMRLRCIHDDFDFSSAFLQCVQDKNRVLGTVTFLTDCGDKHPSLDILENASFTANNLRIRLEFGGDINHVEINTNDNRIYNIAVCGIPVTFNVAGAEFSNEKITFETGTDGKTKWIDLVIYKGADKLIDLVNTEKAYMCFALGVDTTAECTVEDNGEMLTARSDNLSIETFVAPKDFNTYIKNAKGYTDGIEY